MINRELEAAATEFEVERMSAGTHAVGEAWRNLPPETKKWIQRQLRWALADVLRGRPQDTVARVTAMLLPQLYASAASLAVQGMSGPQLQAAIRQIVRAAPIPPVLVERRKGMSRRQVQQYHRRQQARGFVPGRSRQTKLYRELEFALEQAAHELEAPEPFFTRVTPIPGIGNKEGHEILTRIAMRGLPLSAADQSAILLGVIRPDRGGRSYWNFPRSALESLKARAQPSHSLRPTPSSTVATALRLIRARFVRLYLRAMRASNRRTALQWVGEAMHLLQDSFSSAHVERAGGIGRIRHIRAFYVRFGWPPLSRAPHEHRAPSDPRDDVYLRGALRPQARAAVRASRDFLTMALRHLRAPRSPRNVVELRAFMSRYLSM